MKQSYSENKERIHSEFGGGGKKKEMYWEEAREEVERNEKVRERKMESK